jgi:tetratricopeptide (TPR) repeat protein
VKSQRSRLSSREQEVSAPRNSLFRLSAAIVIIAGVFCSIVWLSRSPSPDGVLPPGLSQDQYLEAARAWQAKHGREPEQVDVLVWLADSFAVEGKLNAAIACYEAIPSEHPSYGPGARLEQAKALIRLNRAPEAEANLTAFMDVMSEDRPVSWRQLVEALDLLRFLLEVQLRFEETRKVLRVIHSIDAARTFETMAYCFPSVLRWNGEQSVRWLEGFVEENPDDFKLRVALGRYRTGEGKLAEAEKILQECCRQRPENLYAWAALLACYYEQDDWARIRQAMATLPPIKNSDPWLLSRLRGHLHNHEAQFQEAVECFQQALAADPANAESYLGLAQAYAGLKRDGDRATALRKAHVIARLQNRTGWASVKEGDVEPLLEMVGLCEEIDLGDQALLVAKLVLKIDPDNVEAKKVAHRLQSARDDARAPPEITQSP